MAKDIPTIDKEIRQIIEDSICKNFHMSPIEKSERVYADIKIRFEKIQKLKDKELYPKDNVPLSPKELRQLLGDMYENLPDDDEELIKVARNMHKNIKQT